jgi:hypothetical protein
MRYRRKKKLWTVTNFVILSLPCPKAVQVGRNIGTHNYISQPKLLDLRNTHINQSISPIQTMVCVSAFAKSTEAGGDGTREIYQLYVSHEQALHLLPDVTS